MTASTFTDPTYLAEFPDFDPATMPEIPAGFVDTSWRNDLSPSFHSRDLLLVLFVDFADVERREFQDGKRFMVCAADEEGGRTDDQTLLETDNWADVVAFVERVRSGGAWAMGEEHELPGHGFEVGKIVAIAAGAPQFGVLKVEGSYMPVYRDGAMARIGDFVNPTEQERDFGTLQEAVAALLDCAPPEAGNVKQIASETGANDNVRRLAEAFAKDMEESLTGEQFEIVKRRNTEIRAKDPTSTCCATHDFCDANMVMLDAFTRVFDREPRHMSGTTAAGDWTPEQEADIDLWNASWTLAQALFLSDQPETERARLEGVYGSWLERNGFSQESGDLSAEALLHSAITTEQRRWLSAFVVLWEDMEAAESAASKKEA